MDEQNTLVGTPGEVILEVVITRAETGKKETYSLVGKIINEQENKDESNTQRISSSSSN